MVGNALHYGDNLAVLREHIATESVDLIYLDPPFNSRADYNILFRNPTGERSQAQIEAFEDTWHWSDEAEAAFDDVMRGRDHNVADMLRALRSFLGENDMMAYLAMMAVRLVELHRVLKATGSLYLHCDPTASHYLRVLLDGVFGPGNFRSEIVWRRSPSHNKLSRQYGPIHDVILFYGKTDRATFHPTMTPYTHDYIEQEFRGSDARGRYRLNEIMGPGIRSGESGRPWRGYDPSKVGRHWAIPSSVRDMLGSIDGMSMQDQLDAALAANMIVMSRSGRPKYKQYPGKGVVLQDIWAFQPGTNGCLYEIAGGIDQDVKWLDNEDEKLGYQTQKPVGLLERIIASSSDPGQIVLDPFCGCGTAVHAAQKLDRHWIGIDVTHLAISLIEKRLSDAFPGIAYEVHGTPKDIDGAAALAADDKYQFQWWAVSLVNAVPYGGKKKGADGGIDGIVYFKPDARTTEKAIVSVKAGANINVGMIRDLGHVVDREKAKVGIFITLAEPTGPMRTEAVKAGFYETDHGRFPKLQILTIAELFNGKRPALPWLDPRAFKKAPREVVDRQAKLRFG